jgi:hypothetical protein
MAAIKYLTVSLSKEDISRVFKKVEVDPATGCWNWTGAKLRGVDYGVVRYQRRAEYVHRLLYAWLVSPIPMRIYGRTHELDHVVCNNPPCCNPFHLHLVSHKANMLRGDNPPSLNARKIYCNRGHVLPIIPNEVYGKGRTGRRCILCRRINRNARYHRQKEAAQIV